MKVDGKPVAKLVYPRYFRLSVPPGVYDVALAGKTFLCHLVAGESCYVRVKVVERRPVADLLSFNAAAIELQKVQPLDREKVIVGTWK